jgi:Potential Queuosine, Q, salvage protein family
MNSNKQNLNTDYRVPQILHSMGAMYYCPPLEHRIKTLGAIDSGSSWEVQIRGCTIWCIELIRREIKRRHPESKLNAVLIDFFLYDLMKEREARGAEGEGEVEAPHHRTRSIWY